MAVQQQDFLAVCVAGVSVANSHATSSRPWSSGDVVLKRIHFRMLDRRERQRRLSRGVLPAFHRSYGTGVFQVAVSGCAARRIDR